MASEQFDTSNIYNFLTQTPEAGLRKMLIDHKTYTESHFNLMMKIIRASNETQFGDFFTKQEFPKIKMNPNDLKIKEKFWNDFIAILKARGLASVDAKNAS